MKKALFQGDQELTQLDLIRWVCVCVHAYLPTCVYACVCVCLCVCVREREACKLSCSCERFALIEPSKLTAYFHSVKVHT